MELDERLKATWRPQRWISHSGDQLEDIEGSFEFDATEAFLSRTLEEIRTFEHNNYSSDQLAEDLPQRVEHRGPFEVDTDVDDWLERQAVPDRGLMTQADLDRLRAEFYVKVKKDKSK